VDVIDDPLGNRVTKCATTDAERTRLVSEARALRALAHPGVVRLIEVVGDPPAALVLERVTGGPLGRMRGTPIREVARLAAALATTVADMHDVGWIHGAIRLEHVLLDGRDQPVLCGFGSAAPVGKGDVRLSQDLDDLARLILALLPAEVDGKLQRYLARPRRLRKPDARQIAGRMLLATESQPRHPRVSRRYVAAAGLAIAAAVSVAILAGDHRTAPSCRAVDAGCAAAQWTPPRTYRLAFNGPKVVVVGRWDCNAIAYPAVLALDTGAVWVFRGWPRPDRPAIATLAGLVLGARSLSVLPSSSGCDRIAVSTPNRVVVVDPGTR
jgi:serine/threonine protein kinase